MKRRDFLLNSAGLAGVLVARAGSAQVKPCPPPSLTATGGTSATSPCVAGDAEADWAIRSTASGVMQAVDFRDSQLSLFTMGRFLEAGNPYANVARDTSGIALTGGACLRINIPAAAGSEAGSWRCFLNSEWNSRDITAPQQDVGMGNQALYVQYRVRFPASYLAKVRSSANALIPTQKKQSICSVNHRSNIEFEHVIQNTYGYGVVQSYRRTVGHVPEVTDYAPFAEGLGAYDINLQNQIPGPNFCRWSNGFEDPSDFPYCYQYTPDVWMCLYFRIRIASYGGSSGNEWDLWAWKPGETGYTHLQSFRNYACGVGQPKGFNGLWLLPYDTTRHHADLDSYVLYDQVITSTSPIVCPTV